MKRIYKLSRYTSKVGSLKRLAIYVERDRTSVLWIYALPRAGSQAHYYSKGAFDCVEDCPPYIDDPKVCPD